MRFDIPTHSEIKEIVRESFKEVLINDLPSILRKTNRKLWVSPKELYELAGISERKQQYLRDKKRIPYHKEGRKILYNMDEIEDWLKSNKIEARN